jgi:uncharacterized protein YqeY
MLSSALNYEKIAKLHELGDEEEVNVVRSEAKKRKDAIEAYEKAGAKDRAEKESSELKILQEFMPAEMGDEELKKIVLETITEMGAKDKSEMGKVIGAVRAKTKGNADGKKIADLVLQNLK